MSTRRIRHQVGGAADRRPRPRAAVLPAVLMAAVLALGTTAASADVSPVPGTEPTSTATPAPTGAVDGTTGSTATSTTGTATATATPSVTGTATPSVTGTASPSEVGDPVTSGPEPTPVLTTDGSGGELRGTAAVETSAAAGYPDPVAPVTMLTPPDGASRYQGQVTCDPVEKPGAAALRSLLRATYGTANSGGITRACSVGGTSEHKEGRAYDWMLDAGDPAERAVADAFLAWLVGPDGAGAPAGNARRLGVQYVIWDRQIWQSWTGTWKAYTGASPHTDHIHLSLSWDGAFKRTSFWTGTAVTPVDHGPCQVYSGVLVAPYSAPNYTRCSAPLPPPNDPTGWVELARPDMRSAVLRGWAKDADTKEPLSLHLYVDGRWGGVWTADRWRADLGGAYGFELRVPLDPGTHEVCVYAINVGSGTTNPSMGCRTVAPLTGNPVGNLERVVVGPGGVQVSGWTIDPDTDASVVTHAYVNGRWAGVHTAGAVRPDVGSAYPLMGSRHGLSTMLRTAPGPQRVCVYPINVGAGTTNPLLGCRDVVSLGSDPLGNVEQVRGGDGTVVVSGWTLDPDAAGSIPVHVYVDGRWRAASEADRSRPDVAAAYPGWQDARGFAVEVGGLSSGRHEVCTYAINSGPGTTNPLLSCGSVVVG